MVKTYLGDGVYVNWDGYGLVLTAEDGRDILETIYLEPEVYAALAAYVDRYVTHGTVNSEASRESK